MIFQEPNLNNGFIVIECDLEGLISISDVKHTFIQHIELTNHHVLFSLDENIMYRCLVYKTTIPDNYWISQQDNDSALALIPNLITNKPLVKRQKDGARWVSSIDLQASELIWTTVNYTDKTTWYSNTQRITGQTLTGDVSNTIFSAPNGTVIVDLYHGKIFDEDDIAATLDPTNKFEVKVYVDGVLKTMREPFSNSGGDYEVDYINGRIIFYTPQANVNVTADYTKTLGSSWKLVPDAGKVIEINYAEIDTSSDIIMNDSIVFTAYGYVDVFAPHLMPGIPSGTQIPIDITRYKTIRQLRQEAIGTTPAEPALGGAVRGVQTDWRTMPFRYRATRQLWALYGMYLEIKLENDQAFTGENATATFHCLSRKQEELL